MQFIHTYTQKYFVQYVKILYTESKEVRKDFDIKQYRVLVCYTFVSLKDCAMIFAGKIYYVG